MHPVGRLTYMNKQVKKFLKGVRIDLAAYGVNEADVDTSEPLEEDVYST